MSLRFAPNAALTTGRGTARRYLVAADDVTLLSEVGRSKKIALNSVGVRSIRDIPPFDFLAGEAERNQAKND